MPARFVNIDRDTPSLLPQCIQDWVPADSPARLVVELTDHLDLSQARVNHSGSGSEQYPPSMMLPLLLFSYSHGVFSSRRIEESTHYHAGVRYITGDTHPDHDSICKFRRENKPLIRSAFAQSLRLAGEAGILEIGNLTASFDGTKIKADVNAHEKPTIQAVDEELAELEKDQKIVQSVIEDLLAEAERTDREEKDHPAPIPAELADPAARAEKLKEAKAILRKKERRAANLQAARALFTDNKAARAEQRDEMIEEVRRSKIGTIPRKCSAEVDPATDKVNPADPDAVKMKSRDGYIEGYNAQAGVDSGTSREKRGSGLIISAHVTTEPTDRHQVEANVAEAVANLGEGAMPTGVFDAGYDNTYQIHKIEANGGPTILAEQQGRKTRGEEADGKEGAEARGRRKRTQEKRDELYERLRTEENREKRGRRKESVEPTFGVVKEVMGFRRFTLRGLEKVDLEWRLVAFAFNMRKLRKNPKWISQLKKKAA